MAKTMIRKFSGIDADDEEQETIFSESYDMVQTLIRIL